MSQDEPKVISGYRGYAERMARGDCGRHYLNEFFGIVNQSVDGMLREFGLLGDWEKTAPSRKPLSDQEDRQPPPKT